VLDFLARSAFGCVRACGARNSSGAAFIAGMNACSTLGNGEFLLKLRAFLLTQERTNGKVGNSLQSEKVVRSLTREAASS
jgi:hypothetical protein